MRYELETLVGEGAMGQVFAARDESGRALVVKRLRDTASWAQLATEAELLRRVTHHNVVRLVDSGDGFIVMDRAEGITLQTLIDRDGALAPRRAFAIAQQIVAGLAAIHGEGILHRDLKSSNILIGEHDRVTIIDFGLAHPITSPSRDDERTISGTPAYMAPELASGAPPTWATDLYSVGVIIYEMLTGDTVFAGAADMLAAHRFQPVTPPSCRVTRQPLSAAIDRFVLCALAKSPAERFESAGEMGRALDRLVTSEWQGETMQIAIPRSKTIDENAPSIIAALDRAQYLIENRCTQAAIDVLEGAAGKVLSAEVWRIEMVLAALYDTIGRKERARRFAGLAYAHARETGIATAIERTQALAERLAPVIATIQPRKLARGSGKFRV